MSRIGLVAAAHKSFDGHHFKTILSDCVQAAA